jgi:hypothetical protein
MPWPLYLLVGAVLARAGDLADLSKPLVEAEVGVWIYSEALPKALICAAEANLILRGLSLNQAEKLPPELLTDFFEAARRFVEEL